MGLFAFNRARVRAADKEQQPASPAMAKQIAQPASKQRATASTKRDSQLTEKGKTK
jgi:hypothetical protein